MSHKNTYYNRKYKASLPIFYENTERRLPICYSKSMIMPHTLLLKKKSATKNDSKKAVLLNIKTLNAKKNALTRFKLQ